MENRQISLEQLSDIYGFRVVVDGLDACYRALGIVHSAWRAVPGRFKDYVSTPKQNNYQSIHTTVVGPRHQWVELQIRTREMHQHRRVRRGRARPLQGRRARQRRRRCPERQRRAQQKENPLHLAAARLVDTLLEGDNPEEFLEHTKLELFQDQVFCFTPKGRLIALPRGATPIDFAYAVHTDVGNSCVGAVINGRQLPLTTQLRNGDQVEILMAQGPDAARRLGAHRRHRQGALLHPPRRARCSAPAVLRARPAPAGLRLPQDRPGVFRRQAQEGPGAADAEVGGGGARRRRPRRAARKGRDPRRRAGSRARPGTPPLRASAQPSRRGPGRGGLVQPRQGDRPQVPLARQRRQREGQSRAQVLPIRGLTNDVPVKFEEGGAVPGDRIVGVLSDGEGIRIFQIHSPKLKDYEHEQLDRRDLGHRPDNPERFPAKIVVTALNEPGTLAQIAQVIGEADGNIDNVRMLRRRQDFTEMLIELEVWDLDHLTQIIAGLKSKAVVSSVERMFG